MSYTFNTDLLIGETDRKEAQREFPNVFFGLDNPVLRETFAPFDERAIRAKTKSRRWGVFAVFLATSALLLAGGELLYHDLPKYQVRIIAGLGGVAGIVSVIIGVFGVMFRERKMRWLSDRLACERIRQYHFQAYVMGAASILNGAKDESAKMAHKENFDERFLEFREAYLPKLSEELNHIVHSEDTGFGEIVVDDSGDVDPFDPHLEEYFRAYSILRFERQIGYCNHILRERKGFWKHAPVRQAQILGAIALFSVMGILVLHGFVFAGAVANIAWMKGPLIHVFAIWAAIIALAARTFEEGFQPEREIERMRQYRLSLQRIYARFNDAKTPEAKISCMKELEKLTYEEMVLFLKGNYEAQFVM